MNNTYNSYIDREKSWLTFNARVLQEANDANVPLLDRFRFLGIFSNNLDEFFRVRYAAIRRMSLESAESEKILGVKAEELLKEITEIVIEQQSESLRILNEIEKKLELENEYNAIDKEREKMEQLKTELKTNQQKLEYNSRVQDYNERIKSYSAKMKALVSETESYNSEIEKSMKRD